MLIWKSASLPGRTDSDSRCSRGRGIDIFRRDGDSVDSHSGGVADSFSSVAAFLER